jgi:hypothetical protein
MSTRIRRTIAAICVACAAGLVGATVGFTAPRAEERIDPTQTAARLARENELIGRQIGLATGKGFYLALDPQAKKLDVMLAGVTLREYEVQRMRVGVPRSFSCSGQVRSDWVEHVWRKGVLEPQRDRDRVQIVATGDSTTMPDVPIPPLPEEAYTVPPRYFIRYGGGFSIEIRSETGTGIGTQVAPTFWQSLLAPLRKSLAERAAADTESVRLMVQLPDSSAGALYRSLPPDIDFIILYDPEPGK